MIRAALLCLLLAGCVSVPSQADLRATTLRLLFQKGICSGTATAPDTILTAAHCMKGDTLVSANGTAVEAVEVKPPAKDVISIRVKGKPFKAWATRWGHAVQGQHIRFWGNPIGEPDIMREGMVARAWSSGIVVQALVCHGDSGAGVFDDAGRIVGVVSGMTANIECDFMVAQPWG
jgi:V8-like Glu-specific endopeptidase